MTTNDCNTYPKINKLAAPDVEAQDGFCNIFKVNTNPIPPPPP